MTTKELANKLVTDKEAAVKFADCKSLEDAYAVAKEYGITDSFEEFQAAGKEFAEASAKMSADDAAAVAGGGTVIDGDCAIG